MRHRLEERIKEAIREVPDFPKIGINFYDITTVLKDAPLFQEIIRVFTHRYRKKKIDSIVGIEARGFIFGPCLAYNLNISFVPIRKLGKLPAAVERIGYTLEYGESCLEIHKDALEKGQNVVLVDDLLATGGTARSSMDLIHRLGASVTEFLCLVELSALSGRAKLMPTPVFSLVQYKE